MDHHAQDFQEQEVNLKDYLQVILRRKYIILLVFLVSLPLIFIRAFSGEPMYLATAKLLIERNTIPTLMSEYRLGYDPDFLVTQTQIIKSKKVARQVVEKMRLDETYTRFFPDLETEISLFNKVIHWFQNLYQVGRKLAGVSRKPVAETDTGQLTEQEEQEQLIDALARMISDGISVSRSSRDGGRVVDISFVSANPVLSADIVNTVATAYKHFLLEMRTDSTAEALAWMEEKAADQREKLEASERKLQQYKKEQDIVTINDQEAIFPGRLASLSNRLTKVQAEMGEMESLYREISRISLAEALNLPEVTGSATVSSLRKQMIEQEQLISNLSRTIGEKHPRMIRAREDLQALREKLDREVQGVIQSIKNKYELARDQAESIEVVLEETKQDAALMNEKLIQFEILKRDVDVNALLYDRMLQRMKEYDATDATQSIDVWVVEEAVVPEFPFNKRPRRTLMLGLLVSLMLGIGLAFFLEYLDNTVKTSEDAEARLGLPVLGMIPFLKDDSSSVEKIVIESPRSVISENYKSLRTAVLLSSASGSPRSVLISSMNPRTGKTVTATNLATAFAQSDRRVLLVDADMRRPRIHEIFGLDNKTGLSTFLAGQSDVCIHKNLEPACLHVMPSGPVPPNPSELLIPSRMGDMIKDLREAYDCIIIDSPPMLNVTDASLISKVVDQTLLVIRSGVSTYDSLLKGEKMLATIDARVLGYLINGVEEKTASHYYYKYYGGYYSTYSSDKV